MNADERAWGPERAGLGYAEGCHTLYAGKIRIRGMRSLDLSYSDLALPLRLLKRMLSRGMLDLHGLSLAGEFAVKVNSWHR